MRKDPNAPRPPSDSDTTHNDSSQQQLSENDAVVESKDSSNQSSRRQFMQAAAIVPLVTLNGASSASAQDSEAESKFLPKEQWKDRMQAPDDGKRFGWFIDTRRCFGCHGCEVSCKAENDVPLGNYIRQTFYKDVGEFPKVARMFLPMACQHCEDAPCIKACPCGALHKGTGGSVLIDYDICCGHGTCVEVCPYGAIYMDPAANQAVKCHNCVHRVENSMEPACANTCPSDAIYFGDLNDSSSKVSVALAAAEQEGLEVSQLRPEKETNPRMWFAGPSPPEVEERIPREGESYGPEAYNIYNWKESKDD